MPSPSLSTPNLGRRPGCLSSSRRPLFAVSLAVSESLLTNSGRRCPRTRRPAGTPTGRHCPPRHPRRRPPSAQCSRRRRRRRSGRRLRTAAVRCACLRPSRRLLSLRRAKRGPSLCACFCTACIFAARSGICPLRQRSRELVGLVPTPASERSVAGPLEKTEKVRTCPLRHRDGE